MSSAYGRSFADQLIADGKYEEAIAAADRAIALDEDDAEAHGDRAAALYYLGRHEESVRCYERAIAKHRAGGTLDDDLLDDAYYESLRAWAVAVHEAGDSRRAAAILDGYPAHAPTGRHAADRRKWYDLFEGRLPKVISR